MEFEKEENSHLQYSDTREEEEEEGEGEGEEVEEEEVELFQDQSNMNKVIYPTTNYKQLPLLSSSLGSPSSSSSVTKKWMNNISIAQRDQDDHDHHHHGAPELFLSDMTRMSWAGEREHMFDKVVTPSDVGKLNRLVIPKQHAEKYFPLDPTSTDKGLLLNFEDRTGKCWRFRYSYWNSSQSYVMTKGWSRFVKEKKLDAGDIVSFHRSSSSSTTAGGGASLFIDWRRRPTHHHYPNYHHHQNHNLHHHPSYYQQYHHQRWGYSLPQSPAVPPAGHEIGAQSFNRRDYMANTINNHSNYYYYGHHMGVVRPPILFESVPVTVAAAPAAQPKRLRLFGVNMEYSPSQEDPNDYRYRHQISSSSHHHQVRLPNNNNNNIPSQLFPLLPTATTTSTSGSSFPEFSQKGKSSANSLSFDLDP